MCLSTDEATEFQEVDAKLTADCLFVCGITVSILLSLNFQSKICLFLADSTRKSGIFFSMFTMHIKSRQCSYVEEGCLVGRSFL